MKKITILFNIILLTIFNCQAQEYVLDKTITFSTNITQVEVDPFSNVYVVEDYKVSKYSENGKLLSVYQDIENGAISSIDVSNPMKPIIFCRDFSILQILDKRLSLVNTINLTDINLDFVETIAVASGDQYWVYDNATNTLKRLNRSLQVLYESESFLNLLGISSVPSKIIESEQNVYVLDKEGIRLFDNFGNYIKTLNIPFIEDFQIVKGKVIYLFQDNLIAYNLKNFEEEKLQLPYRTKLQVVKLFKNGLLILDENQLHIYIVK